MGDRNARDVEEPADAGGLAAFYDIPRPARIDFREGVRNRRKEDGGKMKNCIHSRKSGFERTAVRHVTVENLHFGRELFCKRIARQGEHADIDTAAEKFTTERPPHDAGATRNQSLHQVSSM